MWSPDLSLTTTQQLGWLPSSNSPAMSWDLIVASPAFLMSKDSVADFPVLGYVKRFTTWSVLLYVDGFIAYIFACSWDCKQCNGPVRITQQWFPFRLQKAHLHKVSIVKRRILNDIRSNLRATSFATFFLLGTAISIIIFITPVPLWCFWVGWSWF